MLLDLVALPDHIVLLDLVALPDHIVLDLVALPDHIVIPAEEAPHLIGMVSGQSDSSFTTEAIGPKIFSHYLISFSLGFIFTTH